MGCDRSVMVMVMKMKVPSERLSCFCTKLSHFVASFRSSVHALSSVRHIYQHIITMTVAIITSNETIALPIKTQAQDHIQSQSQPQNTK